MAKPIVAIVGRPNVGKSTFFNKMAGRRVSIVNDMPGVTRDRIYVDAEWCGYAFTLVDTGGIELKSEDQMWKHIRRQAELALDIADVILLFVDGKSGIMADDYDVAQMLRCTNKPVVLAVNKVDGKDDSVIHDFWALNLGEPYPISAEQSLGLGDLLDAIVANFDERTDMGEEEEAIKIAVVGKPNSGKSSLTNRLLGFERVIVSNIAGTTRDAIDTPFEYNGRKCILIDTAGIRKKSKVEEDIEYYSVIRSISAIRRADIVLVVVDSAEMLSEQDIRICGLVHDAGKPSVLVMNKWDLIEKDTHTVNRFTENLKNDLKFMTYLKTVFISALTGKRVNTVLDTALAAYENASQRIPTGVLNDVIGDAIAVNEPPTHNGKRLKIFYANQPSTNPPTFVIFCNDGKLMHFSYKRYIENALRKAFDFSGTPVKIVVRSRDEEK
ncbi:MAG: ribosome biogenesis GTPase Der [Clostridia bacterium]|nr:ribosome biogenesis GTPase Der [Clostridia bacterium]MBO7156011.1 ribosome biogenesis GTPase Der [Clostridia bacterium]